MNFNLTKSKTITSLIISLIIGVVGGFFALCFIDDDAKACAILRIEVGAIYFAISLVIIYLIWSLIQKKNK